MVQRHIRTLRKSGAFGQVNTPAPSRRVVSPALDTPGEDQHVSPVNEGRVCGYAIRDVASSHARISPLSC